MANIVSRVPADQHFTVLASAARTATPDTQEFELVGHSASGLHVVIDVTAVTLTPSVTVNVSGVDRVSGKTYTLIESAAITAIGTTVLKVGPGLTAAANTVANDIVPSVIRVTATHADADSITYSVGAHLS